MSNQKIRRTRKKRSSVVPLLIICSAITFSALAAAIWQFSSPKIPVAAPLELDPSVIEQFPSDSVAVSIVSSKTSSSDSSQSSSAVSQSEESSSAAAHTAPSQSEAADSSTAKGGAAVKKSERVNSSYFDDAAFIGDSITVGIKLYDIMGNADVFASVGIGLDSIFTKQAIKQPDGAMLTVFDALQNSDSQKVYIMLGANSLMSDYDYLIAQYGKIVDEVKKRTSENTVIYVQSILPINEPLFRKNYPKNSTTNADIDDFNTLLCSMAQSKGVYYLDVASAFKTSDNSLPAEVTSDGMHISSEQYVVWIDYLKTHTANSNN